MSFIDRIRAAIIPPQPPAQAPKPANVATPQVHTRDTFSASNTSSAPMSLTGESNASVSVSPDEVSGKLDGKITGPKGISVSIEASAQASQKTDVQSENGYTTYTVTSDASFTVGGEVDAGVVGFGANQTEGVTTTYQVRMSDEDYARMQAGEIPEPNPFDPTTMPPGSSVMMNSEDYSETGMSVSYRQLSIDSDVSESEGTSMVFEMGEDNQLTVTGGPTQAVENSFKLGISLGPVSAHIGNTTSLEGFTLHTATFDLDSEGGLGSYGEFLVTGEMPKHNGEGVTDAAKIEKLNYDSTSTAGVKVGPFDFTGEIGSSHLNQVRTTLPDGSSTLISNFDLHPGNFPVELEQAFNADGTEDVEAQKMSMHLAGLDESLAAYVYAAFTGVDHETAVEKVKGEEDLVLTLTHEDAEKLIDQAQDHIAAWEKQTGRSWDDRPGKDHGELGLITELSQAGDLADVADILAHVDSDGIVSQGLLQLSGPMGDEKKLNPLPGDVSFQ